MDRNMMECSKMAKNGVKVHTNGRMSQFTQACGLTITSKEKVSTDGPMAEYTMVNGKKISYMEKEFTRGRTEGNMKESIKLIKSMDTVRISGPMARHMKDNGSMESNMEKQGSQIQKVAANLVFGKMVNVSNGLMQRVRCVQEVRNHKILQKAA